MPDSVRDLSAPAEFVEDASNPSGQPVHLVLLLHGILSISDRWRDLEDEGRFGTIRIKVRPVSYRMVGLLDLLGRRSDDRLPLVADRIDHWRDNEHHDFLSIHCHSYGTKVFAQLPPAIHAYFDYIFFAGSICHMDDDRKFRDYKRTIINDCGKLDPWPHIAGALKPQVFGATGVTGFQNPPFNDRPFPYGHSNATSRKHFRSWIVPVMQTGDPYFDAPASKRETFGPRFLLYATAAIQLAAPPLALILVVLAVVWAI